MQRNMRCCSQAASRRIGQHMESISKGYDCAESNRSDENNFRYDREMPNGKASFCAPLAARTPAPEAAAAID